WSGREPRSVPPPGRPDRWRRTRRSDPGSGCTDPMTKRIVVIGADAAGMSAASQAKRIAGDAVEIVAFERGAYSSYYACGIPCWVAGDVDGPERLVARSPDAHRRNGIDLRMRPRWRRSTWRPAGCSLMTWPQGGRSGKA